MTSCLKSNGQSRDGYKRHVLEKHMKESVCQRSFVCALSDVNFRKRLLTEYYIEQSVDQVLSDWDFGLN